MREKSKEDNVNYDYCEIETKNVELENSVAKLLSENKRLCKEINHVKQECLEPLAPSLLQNREAHIDYLKYTQEQADILQEIVEQAKAKQPLDKELDFACKHGQRIQELMVYVRDTCPNAIKLSAKKVVVTPKNNVKKVRFAEPLTSSSNIKQVESSTTSYSNTPVFSPTGLKCSTSNYRSKPTVNKKKDRISQTPSRNMKNRVEAQPRKVNKRNRVVEPIHDVDVKHSLLKAISELICATCKKSMFDGVHDMCLLDFMENVNSRAKSAKKHKKQNIWKPMGHVFTEVGLKWKPTGRTFTIVGSSKKAKIIESKNANHSEPNHTWGSNATDIPSSSSLVMTVRFGNDHIARIMRYGDYQLGNVTISRVHYILRHKFYTISLDDMLKTSPICLLSKASKTKSWLCHRRLSHLNFGTVNKLAKDSLARGIPRLKFQKDHMCSACALGKSKKSSHQPKAEDANQEKLYLFHMVLCGPMCVASINGKRPSSNASKNIQVSFNATICNVRTDNGAEFVNQTLREFYENVGISHQTSVARTPQQNDVVERQNQTLVEAAHTIEWHYKVKTDEFVGVNKEKELDLLQNDLDKKKKSISRKSFDNPSHVYKLKKALYGLNQVDPTLFTWQAGKDLLLVQIYVDDIIFASTNTTTCNELANQMTTKFKRSMMGQMSFFLGLQISQSPRGIFINQSKYDYEFVKKYALYTTDSVNTPMVEKNKLDKDLQGKQVHATLYRGMIGSLMYLTSSRPDLIYVVCLCARIPICHSKLMQMPTTRGVKTLDIVHSEVLSSYVTNLLAGHPRSKRALLSQIPLYCDNKSAIALCCNNVQHSRAKHIDVRYYFIKEYEKHVSRNVVMSGRGKG
ncbi:uncharacterized mitochondrial protein-like protein [Tanacetum coccineum]